MGTLLQSIFCCTSSPKPSKVAIKPQTNTSSQTSDPQKLQKNRLKSHVNMDKDANDMSNIPMEYVNPKDESPQEVAIKGRRQSVVVIPPGEQTSETSTEQESHQSIPAEEPRQGNSLLPAKPWPLRSRKCLVLDLDETLVHSSFKYLWNADFMIPVQIDNQVHQVYVVKRPGVDEFLAAVSELYEVVVFTASVSRYGDPLLDHLDKDHKIHHRLFRESCYNQDGNYLKDLSALGRPLNDVIIIDNSPAAYALQPFNAVPVSSWFSDMHDNELLDMIPFLQDLATKNVPDVVKILQTAW